MSSSQAPGCVHGRWCSHLGLSLRIRKLPISKNTTHRFRRRSERSFRDERNCPTWGVWGRRSRQTRAMPFESRYEQPRRRMLNDQTTCLLMQRPRKDRTLRWLWAMLLAAPVLGGIGLQLVSMWPYWVAIYRGKGANLYGAALPRARLGGADLRDAALYFADLRAAVLQRADLRGAELRQANLEGADLAGADLRDAWLGGTNLAHTDPSKANLQGARYDLDTLWPKGFDPRKCGAVINMEGYDCRGVHLRGADLAGAFLTEADFTNADLTGANLSHTYLAHTWFDNANLKGVKLTGAKYDRNTHWPTGFDPEAHGATSMDHDE
jgi:hypothetical protein